MHTMFRKAVSNAEAYGQDFTTVECFPNKHSAESKNHLALATNYAELLGHILYDRGARNMAVGVGFVSRDRYKFCFMPSRETPLDAFLIPLGLWRDIKSLRVNGSDDILVGIDEYNLPVLSCRPGALNTILHQLCQRESTMGKYGLFFETFDALHQRIAMGNHLKPN